MNDVRETLREQWRDFKATVEKPRASWYFFGLLVLDVLLQLVDLFG